MLNPECIVSIETWDDFHPGAGQIQIFAPQQPFLGIEEASIGPGSGTGRQWGSPDTGRWDRNNRSQKWGWNQIRAQGFRWQQLPNGDWRWGQLAYKDIRIISFKNDPSSYFNQSCICRFGGKYYKFDYKRPSSSPTWSTKTRLSRDKTTRYLKIQRPEIGRSCHRIHGSLADLPPREKTDPFAMQAKKLRSLTVFWLRHL